MSSLRLALKQSLKEAVRDGQVLPEEESDEEEWDDEEEEESEKEDGQETQEAFSSQPKRKRGRPRKHPPNANGSPSAEASLDHGDGTAEKTTRDKQEDGFSSENEFSVSHEEDDDEEEEEEEEEQRLLHHKHRKHSQAAHTIQTKWKQRKQKNKHSHKQKTLHQEQTKQEEKQPERQEQLQQETAPTEHASSTGNGTITTGGHTGRPPHQQAHQHDQHSNQQQQQHDQQHLQHAPMDSEPRQKHHKKNKPKTVLGPSQELYHWQTEGLTVKRARRHVQPGLRVKVLFALRKAGKKKKKWFGGKLTAVSKEGSKVRIRYDDGTTEVAKFPDKDIIVDEQHNGQHAATADKFMPPAMRKQIMLQKLALQQQEQHAEKDNSPTTDTNAAMATASTTTNAAAGDAQTTVDSEEKVQERSTMEAAHQEKTPTTKDAVIPVATDDLDKKPPAVQSPVPPVATAKKIEAARVPGKETSTDTVMQPKDTPVDGPPAAPAAITDDKTAETTSQTQAETTKTSTVAVADKTAEPGETTSTVQTHTLPAGELAGTKQETPGGTEKQVSESSSAAANKDESNVLAVKETGATQTTQKLPDSTTAESNPVTTTASSDIMLNAQDATSDAVSNTEMRTATKGATSTDTVTTTATANATPVAVPPKVKRKRGRPPKHRPTQNEEGAPLKKQKHMESGKTTAAAESSGGIHGNSAHETAAAMTEEDGSKRPSLTIRIPLAKKEDATAAATGASPRQGNTKRIQIHRAAVLDGSPRQKKKKRKLQDAPPLSEPPARSGRRAAQQANERISSSAAEKGTADAAPAAPGDPNAAIQPPASPRAKKKRRKDGEPDLDHTLQQDGSQWVQCDGCGKWRIIPGSVVSKLPKQWYCKDNVYDKKRATCDAPEQTAKQVAKERKRMKRRAQRALLESGEGGEAGTVAVIKKSPRPQRSIVEEPALSPAPTKPTEAEPRRPRGRPRRKPASSGTTKEQEEADNLEWVQCEKCDKWRKLPPHISADDLPDVWYCSMNTWNNMLTCEVPEDKADGLQDVGIFGGTGSAAGKLSYRNLIFGSTGRKANRPISERSRAAESIFGTLADDNEDAPPAVMYATCSAFVSRSRHANSEDCVPSVLDIMSNSYLWSQMRSGGIQGLPTSAYTFDTLPADVQEPLKELLLDILGHETMPGDQVMLEAKNGNRENLSEACVKARSFCTINVVVTTLCHLVREGKVECVQEPGKSWTGFSPRYRRARVASRRKASRCMKISKPWKRLASTD